MEETITTTLRSEDPHGERLFFTKSIKAWETWSEPDRDGLKGLGWKGHVQLWGPSHKVKHTTSAAEEAIREEQVALDAAAIKSRRREEAVRFAVLMLAIYWPEQVENVKEEAREKEARKISILISQLASPV
jgi:hypothetical protein